MENCDNKSNLSTVKRRIINAALAIREENSKDANSIGFMARSMVLATLPHSDPGDVPAWGRRNGNYSLVITPGFIIDKDGNPKSCGIPYGTIPRLLLCWITSEVVKKKQKEIEVGDSLTAFMKKLNIPTSGGKKGMYGQFKNQMIRLFSSSVSCTYNNSDEFTRLSLPITEKTHLLWNPTTQESLWQSTIVLGQEFFNEIVNNPVPIDMRALNALRKSPLQIDLYIWLTYRVSYLTKPIVIPWNSLIAQFGADYSRPSNAKIHFLKALKSVQAVYPQLRVSPNEKGLLINPSRTSVKINISL